MRQPTTPLPGLLLSDSSGANGAAVSGTAYLLPASPIFASTCESTCASCIVPSGSSTRQRAGAMRPSSSLSAALCAMSSFPVQCSKLDLRRLEAFEVFSRQVLARAVDVERQHRHRG